MSGVAINIQQGLSRPAANTYGTSILVGQGYSIGGGVQPGVMYPMYSITDAENLGITQANDILFTSLVWYHISEYFRLAPGTKLYFWMIPSNVTLTTTFTTTNPLSMALNALSPQPLLMGVFKNTAPATRVNKIDDEVITLVPLVQSFCEKMRIANQPMIAIVEGRSFATTSELAALVSARSLASRWVSIVVAQDIDIAALDATFAPHAAVGTALGMKAIGATNQNIGYVSVGTLQDKATGRWINPGLSSNVALSGYLHTGTTDDSIIEGKGYIYVKTYNDYAGVYFGTDPTCAALTDDYYRMGNSHTYCKAHKLIYQAVLPLVNSAVLLDPTTGRLAPTSIAQYESAGDEALRQMVRSGEISGFKVWCDPAQNVLSTDNVLVQFSIVPTGNAGTITGTIKFANKLSA